ncbi:unnamed protein product [Rotaria magnacalcarata]|uniref:Cdc37 Hsp90 binding domain-containing protein n=1 Tax=Rotaria magnacalcarata TaxID=392030 RepID=A0A815KV69_9BILA|nr:unnamed protein product [Rotaria magnacalcarata]CAF1585649.1 unnamed protein product [Rotaria magnacalcarata]
MAEKTTLDHSLLRNVNAGRRLEKAQETNVQTAKSEVKIAIKDKTVTLIKRKKRYQQEVQKLEIISKFTDEESERLYQLRCEKSADLTDDNNDGDDDGDDEDSSEYTDDEQEKTKEQKEFITTHKSNIKEYGEHHYHDAQKFLEDHVELVSEETVNYMVGWCIHEEMHEYFFFMEHLAQQVMFIKSIIRIIQSSKSDPTQCVQTFFERMANDKQYEHEFLHELSAFKERIEQHARQNNDDLTLKNEKEKQQKRLDPDDSGLIEVMKSSSTGSESRDDFLQLTGVLSNVSQEKATNFLGHSMESTLWEPNVEGAKGDDEESVIHVENDIF